MLRSKDLYFKNVLDIKGKRIGLAKEIFIDFYKEKVTGLGVNKTSFISNKNFIDIKDIINIEEEIVARQAINGNGLKFSEIKDMDVLDQEGNYRGSVEDILIEEDTFNIKGLVISSGLIDKMIKGREIILMKKSILSEDFILYLGTSSVVLKNIPHEVNHEYVEKA